MSQRYTVTNTGPDVDLDTEDIRLADGARLTQEVADDLAAEIRSKAGRPSPAKLLKRAYVPANSTDSPTR